MQNLRKVNRDLTAIKSIFLLFFFLIFLDHTSVYESSSFTDTLSTSNVSHNTIILDLEDEESDPLINTHFISPCHTILPRVTRESNKTNKPVGTSFQPGTSMNASPRSQCQIIRPSGKNITAEVNYQNWSYLLLFVSYGFRN